jgi:hypothetical protein
MNLKRYRNELIILGSVLFMLLGYFYKSNISSSIEKSYAQAEQESIEIIKANSLKHIWSNKNISKQVDKLRTLVPSSKVRWSKKAKKVTVNYKGLNANELNSILNKMLNIPFQIENMSITRVDKIYNMELKCKW